MSSQLVALKLPLDLIQTIEKISITIGKTKAEIVVELLKQGCISSPMFYSSESLNLHQE